MWTVIELRGKYGSAKVFTDVVDEESVAQVIGLLNMPYAEHANVRMMPDIHAGAGCTIGTTMRIVDKVCPNLVGVDIGCGMLTVMLNEDTIDFKRLDRVIREFVPAGFEVRESVDDNACYFAEKELKQLRCINHINYDRAVKSIGTLGGGNHFIEVDRNDNGSHYLVIHTGSRHLGVDVAKYYQGIAQKKRSGCTKEEIQAKVNEYIAAGKEKEIESMIRLMKLQKPRVPKDLAWLEGEDLNDYLHDMKIAQEYAELNRNTIAQTILNNMDWKWTTSFHTVHNYIDTDAKILRKGSVEAMENQMLLIPINMRDGSLLCVGKGNSDWNYSAPHGAGRLMSRSKAKEMFSVGEFEEQMKGIYTTSVNASTLDECPMAYKDMQSIIDNIKPTAEVWEIIKPVYNYKAGEE